MSYMISLPYETLKTSYQLPHSNCLNFCNPEDVFKTIQLSQNMHLVLEKQHDKSRILVFNLHEVSDPKWHCFIYLVIQSVAQLRGLCLEMVV
jgi:hypothetical protein